MSAIAERVLRISMSVETRLPALLVPQSDEKLAEQQRDELFQLSERLRLLVRDLKNHENRLRAQQWNKNVAPWAMKQRLADVALERSRAEELAREIERVLQPKGLNPMEAANKIHELIENSELHLDEAAQAIAAGKRIHSSIGPAADPSIPRPTALHVFDSAVPILTFAYLLLRFAAKSRSGKQARTTRAS